MNNKITELLQSAQVAFNNKDYKKAEEYLNAVIERDPSNNDVLHTLGIIAFTTGNITQALEYFKKAARDTENTKFLFNYASVLLEIGHYSKALKVFNKILTILPDHIPTLNKCISILGKMGELTVAEKMCALVIKLDPSNPDAYNNLGNLCKDQGRVEDAITHYRKALSIKPDNNIAASNLLLCLNYTGKDQQVVFEEHREWEKRIRRIQVIAKLASQPINPDKSPLNIGYISADFRIHSVGYFIEPIITNHNKEMFNIFCYADISAPDAITERIQESASGWRPIYNVDDKVIVNMIKKDNIDILVDLAGHSGDNKLSIFLHKPAPIQVTYLGYPNTTGLSTMDFRLTDRWADPENDANYYTEKLYRLSKGFLCYKPPEDVPDVEETPVIKNGYVTFGSFNNLAKINPETVTTWLEILKIIPESKLVIKTKPFNDNNVLNAYKERFINQGIDRDRLLFKGHSLSMEEHLRTYNQIDIALDTFPYNGTTTTCEALLMGTPIITLLGDRHAGRVGNSILSQADLVDLIANNTEAYIKIASKLSNDIQYLIQLNQTLRRKFLQSPLCDSAAFTKTLETAYQSMWKNYHSE